MKKQILSICLSITLIFSTSVYSFADTDSNNTPAESTQPKVEKEIEKEQPKEEVKEENTNTETEPTEATQQETESTTAQTQEITPIKKGIVKKAAQEKIRITLVFEDIRHANGEVTSKTTSNEIGPGGGWGFTKKKFESTTGLRTGDSVTYNGRDYTYSGKWTCNFNPGTPIDASATFYLYNKDGNTSGNTYYLNEDTTLIFKPIYIPKQIYTFTANYIDNIGHGSGGESHEDNGSVGYKHTFKIPADIPENYEFVYWDNETDSKTYREGDALVVAAGELQDNKTVNVYATYKPIVTVNYHDEQGTLLGSVTGKTVNIYENGEAFKKQGKFLGWYMGEELVSSEETKELPLTREEVQTTFEVYAKYKVTPKPEPTPTPAPPNKPKPTVSTTTEVIEVYYGTGDGKEYTPIPHKKTPLAASQQIESWALINLIATLLTFLITIVLLIFAFINKRKESDELEIKNRMIGRIISIVVAIVTGFVFLITEDMSLPMVLVDKWTLIMIAFLTLQLIIMILCKHKEEEIEEEYEGE